MKTEQIKLQMESEFEPKDSNDGFSPKELLEIKESILRELVDLLDLSGKVSNKNKLAVDIFNREKQATTAIGNGIAIPHVRTMQAKEFIIAIGRHDTGFEFDAPDNQPVKLFICMAAPPYDDSLYLKVFKSLAERLEYPGFLDRIMDAEDPHMIIRAFKEFE
jgi:PTS system fructose-specific IIC component